MSTCDVTYSLIGELFNIYVYNPVRTNILIYFSAVADMNSENRNSSDATEEGSGAGADNTVLLSPFVPRIRTFFLLNLESNQTYEFHMMCVDQNGRHYATNAIVFTTGKKNFLLRIVRSLFEVRYSIYKCQKAIGSR